MFACDLLVGLAESPRVLAHLPLGSFCLLLACLLFAPCLPRRKNASLQVGASFSFCLLLACRDAARHVSTGRWLFRVSPLGRYIGWAAFLGPPRYGLLWWGQSFIRRPKVNLPARRICPRRDVWLFVVQYVTPVGCLCLLVRGAAANRVSIDKIAFSLLCVETRFRILAS